MLIKIVDVFQCPHLIGTFCWVLSNKKPKFERMHCPQKVRHYLGAFLWKEK